MSRNTLPAPSSSSSTVTLGTNPASAESYSMPASCSAVRTSLQDAGIDYDSAEAGFLPSVSVELDEDGAGKVFRLIDALEDCDDVQNVYANYDVSDEVLELIG